MTTNSIDHLLQPLRVPAGWTVVYNTFTTFEPSAPNMRYFFGEWLFCATHAADKVGIELRYEPEGNPDGEFVLEYFRLQRASEGNKFKQALIEELRSRSITEIVSAIERIMAAPVERNG